MKRFLLMYILSACLWGNAQHLQEETGVLNDSIPVTGATDEFFAAYIPTVYQNNQPSPIVFIFDPAGRGKVGIQPFISIAEKYGYILVCSNNSRNGPYAPNLEIADRLFKTVFAKYKVNSDRIYTAGFSGGSRLAGTIAVLSGAIQGVIACGAGFAQYPLYFPSKNSRFSYLGIVGNKDMNYREMHKTKEWLESLKISNELIVFEGEHQWPPSEVILRAFNWLEEEAFRKGIKKEDKLLRNENFSEVLRRAADFEREDNLVDAARELNRLIKYYPDLIAADSLQKRLKKINRTKSFRKEKALLNKVGRLEDTLNHKMREKFALELSLGHSPDEFQWWTKIIQELNGKYSSHKETEYQLMAFRLQRSLFAMAGESMDSFLRENKVKEQEYTEELLLIIAPDSPYTHYHLARKYAAWNKNPSALDHLERVLQLGWTDKDFIRNTVEFQQIKNLRAFQDLLDRY